jgi:hypothetical protein
MIVRGSNLAANALLDLQGAERVSASMATLDAPEIVVRRGLQDLCAYALGMNNTAMARALRSSCCGWHAARLPRRRPRKRWLA